MKNLKRYEPMFIPYDRTSVKMDEDCEGEWVKFSDIKDILKPSHNKQRELLLCPKCCSGYTETSIDKIHHFCTYCGYFWHE